MPILLISTRQPAIFSPATGGRRGGIGEGRGYPAIPTQPVAKGVGHQHQGGGTEQVVALCVRGDGAGLCAGHEGPDSLPSLLPEQALPRQASRGAGGRTVTSTPPCHNMPSAPPLPNLPVRSTTWMLST